MKQEEIYPLFKATLFGRFSVCDANGDEIVVKARKTAALLAFLTYHQGQQIERSHLVDLLWADADGGLNSLRGALHSIRKMLGPHADDVLLADQLQVKVKDRSFKRDLWDADGNISLQKTLPLLERLDPVAPEFDEWLVQERRWMATRQVEFAEKSMRDAEPGSEAQLRFAQIILQLDRSFEPAARVAMECHAKAGRLSKVSEVYKDLDAALAADGFQPTQETRQTLDRLKDAQASAIVDIAPKPVVAPGNVPIIAVMPLQILETEAQFTYLSVTIADELVSRMTEMPELKVLARNISEKLHRDQTDPGVYQVNYVLTGSIMPLGDQFRCNFHLSSVDTGMQVWSQNTEFEIGSLSVHLTDLVDSLAAEIVPAVETNERDLTVSRDTENARAYDHYLRGKHLFLTAEGENYLEDAEWHLEKAISLDPKFAPAYIHLIQSYNTGKFLTCPGIDLTASRQKAFEYTERLLGLNTRNPNAHLAMCWCLLWKRNFQMAEQSLETAMALNPYEAHRLNSIGTALVFLGRLDEGEAYYDLAQKRQVQDLDYVRNDYGELYYYKGEYERAEGWLSLGDKRSAYQTLILQAATKAQLGKLAEARSTAALLISDLEARWHGQVPFRPRDGVRWCLEMTPLKRKVDLDNLMEGLSKAGLEF